jgi:hypothetical protein
MFVFAGKVEEDADSIQLWCGDTKTEYPGPSDNGDLSSGSQLPDIDLRTGLGRIEEDAVLPPQVRDPACAWKCIFV